MNDGGPAYPTGSSGVLSTKGMSLRDWFAGKALSAYLSSNEAIRQLDEAITEHLARTPYLDRREAFRSILAKRAYQMADAMLAEREKEDGPPKS